MELIERYRGCLLGLAVGDAVGTAVEFKPPGSFSPVTDMVGGGPFHLRAGQWTDDTSMALCLADSLLSKKGFDARDQMTRYVRWWQEGYLSSRGECFDIGNTTRAALSAFVKHGEPLSGMTDPNSAGNGALMRLAPAPLYFARTPRRAIELAGESSRTTHGALLSVDACRYFAALIIGALQGVSRDELLAPHYTPTPGLWEEAPLAPEIYEIAAGSFRLRRPPEIRGTGYVVRSLEAALWALHQARDFRDGCLRAVNLGNDADTTAAIYGQLAGALFGVGGIPEEWLSRLHARSMIEEFATRLFAERV